MKKLKTITRFLDTTFKIGDFEDSSNNGLQVENSGTIKKVCCGVDASLQFFKEAKSRGANFLVCHHGISWGDSLKEITDLNYKRISFLMKNDMALYGCHLPLDAHPRYGNNIGLCKDFKLQNLKPFAIHGNSHIGFAGKLPKAMRYSAFKKLAEKKIENRLQTMDFGPKTVKSVAVISGGAAKDIEEAGRLGMDVFLSGEPALAAYSAAQEYGINGIFAGHYATETHGVKQIAKLLKQKFKIPAEFVDLTIEY